MLWGGGGGGWPACCCTSSGSTSACGSECHVVRGHSALTSYPCGRQPGPSSIGMTLKTAVTVHMTHLPLLHAGSLAVQ